MITVDIIRDKDHKIVGFEVNGHSGSAPHGEDIICAGVSALTQTALLGIANHLRRLTRWQAGDGLLSMHLSGKPDELTSAVLETMLLGLKEIAKSEPDHVRIVEYRR